MAVAAGAVAGLGRPRRLRPRLPRRGGQRPGHPVAVPSPAAREPGAPGAAADGAVASSPSPATWRSSRVRALLGAWRTRGLSRSASAWRPRRCWSCRFCPGRSAGPAVSWARAASWPTRTQTLLCTYLSAVLLAGLVLNATLGWGWADPLAGLVIAAVAVKEGAAAWRGDACGCGPVGLDPAGAADPAVTGGCTDRVRPWMRRPVLPARPDPAGRAHDRELVVDGSAADLVVGVEEGFGRGARGRDRRAGGTRPAVRAARPRRGRRTAAWTGAGWPRSGGTRRRPGWRRRVRRRATPTACGRGSGRPAGRTT